MQPARPRLAQAKVVRHVIKALATQIVPANELRLLLGQLLNSVPYKVEQLSSAERFLWRFLRRHRHALTLFPPYGFAQKPCGHGGSHRGQVRTQSLMCLLSGAPGRSLHLRVFSFALAVLAGCLERKEPRVYASRQAPRRAHSVDHGPLHSEIGVSLERHPALGIKTPSSLPQPLSTETSEVVKLHAGPHRTRKLPDNDLNQLKLLLEAFENLWRINSFSHGVRRPYPSSAALCMAFCLPSARPSWTAEDGPECLLLRNVR